MIRFLVILLFFLDLSVLFSFPYKIDWYLKSKVEIHYYPEKAWHDFNFFLDSHLGINKKVGVILFQIDNPETYYKFLDGTFETKITSEVTFFSERFVDLRSFKKPRRIPFDDKRRKEILKKYDLSGFIEIEILNSGKIFKEWVDLDFIFLKRIEKYFYKMVVKLFNKNGKLVFFDFVNPFYILENYFKIERVSISGILSENLISIESKSYFNYNKINLEEKNIWEN